MRSILARPASITWLAAAAVLAAVAAPGCRFTAPGAAGDDGVDDAPGIDAAPDAPADAAPDAAYVPACMTDPTYSNNGGHRYKAYSQGTDYETAIDRCAADGAHLVVIETMEENEYLRTLITNDTWIGLDDLATEGTFRWITKSTSTFRRFTSPEPNNSFGEDCAIIRDNGNWNDVGCEYTLGSICECEPTYQPPPTPACRTATTGVTTSNGRRYFFHGTARTWQDAEADCQSIGAHLASIADNDENGDLDARILGPVWIGLTDAVAEGQFQWADGSPSTFHRFGTTVPNNDSRDCTVLQDFGSWADQDCDDTYQYACECASVAP